MFEYYAGILFLTTNRIGDFDEAFASRIHISLYYPPLGCKPTEKIFTLNLKLIRERIKRKGLEIDVDEGGILKFAVNYWAKHEKMRWNGRQIRNACQTALALAEYDAQRGLLGQVVDAKTAVKRKADTTAKVHLTVGHLEIVSKAYLEFLKHLRDVHGRDAERRAKYMGIRARESVSVRQASTNEGEGEGSEDECRGGKGEGETEGSGADPSASRQSQPAPIPGAVSEPATPTGTKHCQPGTSTQPLRHPTANAWRRRGVQSLCLPAGLARVRAASASSRAWYIPAGGRPPTTTNLCQSCGLAEYDDVDGWPAHGVPS